MHSPQSLSASMSIAAQNLPQPPWRSPSNHRRNVGRWQLHIMVGVFLGQPESCHAGKLQMREALGKLRGPDGLENITVAKDDASSIRCKARWRDALFTLTLTSNTGYITVQGPSTLVLAFGSHVASITGGALHVAKATGPPPCNPEEPSTGHPEEPSSGGQDDPEVERPPATATPTSPTSRPLAAAPGPGGDSVAFSASEGSSRNILMQNTVITINETESEGVDGGLSGMLRRLLRISQSRSES